MLKFEGWNTQRNVKYEAKGETPIDLYNNLVSKGIISTVDGDPYELAVMEKYGKTEEDFLDEDGEDDVETERKWLEDPNHYLTDDEILSVIGDCNESAFYQEITGDYETRSSIDLNDKRNS